MGDKAFCAQSIRMGLPSSRQSQEPDTTPAMSVKIAVLYYSTWGTFAPCLLSILCAGAPLMYCMPQWHHCVLHTSSCGRAYWQSPGEASAHSKLAAGHVYKLALKELEGAKEVEGVDVTLLQVGGAEALLLVDLTHILTGPATTMDRHLNEA